MKKVPLTHRVQICINGHDLLKVGRIKYGTCKECNRIHQGEYQKRNKLKRSVIQWRYRGIHCTSEQYLLLYSEQKGYCAICEKHESSFGIKLAVDHNHTTGQIRGLLCMPCNRSLLPYVERKQRLLQKAKDYLDQYNA